MNPTSPISHPKTQPSQDASAISQLQKDLFISRKSPYSPNLELMFLKKVHRILPPQTSVIFDPSAGGMIFPTLKGRDQAFAPSSCQVSKKVFPDTWTKESECPYAVGSKEANVFGTGLGVFKLPEEDARIPIVTANEQNVSYYGLTLLEKGSKINLHNRCPLGVLTYHFHKDYLKDYVLNEKLGGGIPIETHDFCHIYAPGKASSGHVIIGKKEPASASIAFTGFIIPEGKALFLPAGTIHGDATFTGDLTMLVAKEDADAVVFRSSEGEMINPFFLV